MSFPPSPIEGISIAQFAERFRRREISAVSATTAFLARIAALEPRLHAFTFVDAERALAQAAALDKLFAAGIDLGVLMGVPVAVKDFFSVDGMPTGAGSKADIADLVPRQGRFITQLQRAGCVLLGKTRTSEFAMGGFNLNAPPPWNPCDRNVARMTGGSSHGSAVAMAAGLAGFALGSDTGGSVRWPAALCGVVGYKATTNHWPQDGIFPLSHQMDSIGTLTASVADAAEIHAALDGRPTPELPPASSLVLALPGDYFFQNIERPVQACFERACDLLQASGASIIEVPIPEAAQIEEVFGRLITADWLAFFGRDRFLADAAQMDDVVAARVRSDLDLRADEYVRLCEWRHSLIDLICARAAGINGWISPTVVTLPAPCSDFRTVAAVAAWNRLNTQNTRPGNFFGQCGVSLPIHHLGASLPVGLQVCAAPGRDRDLLSTARVIETIIGQTGSTQLSATE